MPASSEISDRIIDAALAGKLEPGQRLGEPQLVTLFDCSRTLARDADAAHGARDRRGQPAPQLRSHLSLRI